MEDTCLVVVFDLIVFGSDHQAIQICIYWSLFCTWSGSYVPRPTRPRPGNTAETYISYWGLQTDHENEQYVLHHAMFLQSGVVAVRRPSNPYFWGYYRGPKYQCREMYLSVMGGEADLAAFRRGLTSFCCRGYCSSSSLPCVCVCGAEYLQGSLLTFPNQRASVTCVFLQ